MTPILFASLPVALTVATFPRTARIVAACMGVVVATAIASSPVAMTAIVVATAIAVVVADGHGVAPTAPGYLDRPAPARPVVAPVRAVVAPVRAVVRFTPPVWDVPTGEDMATDLARLVAARDRAVASRHRTRADAYQARIDLIMMSATVGLA